MKILQALQSNYVGGPQKKAIRLAKELREKDIETIIVCPKGPGTFSSLARREGFKVYETYLPRVQHFNTLRSFLSNLWWIATIPVSVFKIATIIKDENVDIVVPHGLLNIQAPIAAFVTRRKIVWRLVGSLYPSTIVLFFMPFVILMSDCTIVISEKLGAYYLGNRLRSTRIRHAIIYNSISVQEFNPRDSTPAEIAEKKKSLNIDLERKIVGSVGNVNPAKGYEYLIKAARDIKKVGGVQESQKQYFSELSRLITSLDLQEDIIFVGFQEDIPTILSAFDIFVLPSITEGTPHSILEAMAMEKAIIASAVGGVPEQIIDKESGMIVPPRDHNRLAEAILYILDNPRAASSYAQQARARVEQMFASSAETDKYAAIFNDCIQSA
jgi:glycosyltransferase involved in cell wall biosynthesis